MGGFTAGVIAGPFILLFAMLLGLPMLFLNAWVLQIVWGWYMPLLVSWPPLTYVQCVAVFMVIGALRNKANFNKSPEGKEALSGLLSGFLAPFFFLGFAWVVHAIIA